MVLCKSIHFHDDMRENDFSFSFPVTLTFDRLISKLPM